MDAEGLRAAGRRLWDELVDEGTPEALRALVLEAARSVDRLDEYDNVIQGKGVVELMRFRVLDNVIDPDVQRIEVKVEFSNVLSEARQLAGTLRGLLAEIAKQCGAAAAPAPAVSSDLDV